MAVLQRYMTVSMIGLVAVLGVSLSGGAACAAVVEERFVVLRQGETVGQLIARSKTAKDYTTRVDISYTVTNNGRGPTLNETIILDRQGLPIVWTSRGTTTYGGRVSERFSYSSGVARWESSSEKGSSKAARLYLPMDSSPWRLGLFVRALRNASDNQLPLLPSGFLRVETVQEIETGRTDLEVTLYRLTGADLAPDYVALSNDGRLFAQVSPSGMLIREGFEDMEPRLRELALSLSKDRATGLQRRLAHRVDGPLHIRNVRVFDAVEGHTSDLQSVVVSGEHIATVAAGIEPLPGDTVIDGAGGTLVPGLFNMHMHNSVESGLLLLAAGITSARDMGNDNDALAALVSATDAGQVAGPRITRAGLIEGRSPYSARIGIIADTLPDALAAVRWYADNGYRQIKLYSSIDPGWVKPLVNEGRRFGLSTTGHVPAFSSADQVIRDGYSDIAHINQLVLNWVLRPGEDTRSAFRITAMARAKDLDLDAPQVQATIALMRKHRVRLDTTIMVFERLLLSRAGKDPVGDMAYLHHMPIAQQRLLRSEFTKVGNAAEAQAYRDGFVRLLSLLKLLHGSGIQLMPGTDDVAETGFGLHRELELYVKAGIPANEVLQLATLRAAQYLATDQTTGSVETGKYADFFLIPRDPVTDITAIRDVRMVMRGGQVYFPSEIYRELGIRPFADTPAISQVPSANPAAPVATSVPAGD